MEGLHHTSKHFLNIVRLSICFILVGLLDYDKNCMFYYSVYFGMCLKFGTAVLCFCLLPLVFVSLFQSLSASVSHCLFLKDFICFCYFPPFLCFCLPTLFFVCICPSLSTAACTGLPLLVFDCPCKSMSVSVPDGLPLLDLSPVLWSRSWSWRRKELEFLAGACILKFRLRLPAPGQTKVVY
jgi:hypothetical protein